MKMKSMRVPAVVSMLLLAACGGSSGNAALSRTFSYGAPQAPSSSEQNAAASAQSTLSDTTSFSGSADADKGLQIVAFADALAAAALGGAAVPGARPPDSDISRAVRTASTSACATVSGNTVTFTNCSVTESGITITLNGSISASAGVVTWNITGGFSGTDAQSGITFNLSIHQSGNIAVTATTIKGNAVSDFGGTVSGQGQTVSFGLATAVIADLTYQSTPSYCVTGGTVEVKRVWTQKPQGASGAAFADLALKLSWTGCDQFTVAHSQ